MILLISNSFDPTTQNICQWLFYLKKQYLLITDKSELSNVVITNQNISFTKNERHYNSNDFQSIWYRRGNFLYKKNVFHNLKFLEEKINLEFKKINDYIFNKIGINELYYKDINKLKILDIAVSVGLNVPEFLITNSKNKVQNFFKSSQIITKPVDEVVFYVDEKYSYSSFTDEVDLNLLNDVFELSFFQKKIEKKYEIRTFVLNNEFFSIAIFSQKNIKTSVDYRRHAMTLNFQN